MALPKIVRDNIPELINGAGKACTYRVVGEEDAKKYLYDKFLEEIGEFKLDPCVEEAADIYEVFLEIISRYGIDLYDVVIYSNKKRETNGGFTKGIVLDSVF